MTTDRPAHLRAAADRERQLVRNVQKADWRRRMLHAGHIDADRLSNQARRILAWLAEWDDWTVDGVTELLAAAHRSGLDAARPAPATDQRASRPDHTRTVEPVEPPTPVDAKDRPLGVLPAADDPVSARLAALRQRRPETPAVGL